MSSYYLETRGKQGQLHRLRPVSVTDTEVTHLDASGSKVAIPASECFLRLETDTGSQGGEPPELNPDDPVETLWDDWEENENSKSPEASMVQGPVWWPAKVVDVKGDLATCVLEYQSKRLVVVRSKIRPAVPLVPLTSAGLLQRMLPLPRLPPPSGPSCSSSSATPADDADRDNAGATPLDSKSSLNRQPTEAEVHVELNGRLAEPCLVLLPEGDADCVVVATPSASDAKRLALIGGLLGRRLRWKAAARCELEAIAQRLADKRVADTLAAAAAAEAAAAIRLPRLLEEFPVPRRLVGLALGVNGCNVTAARNLSGVNRVHYDNEAGVFRVFGTSPESAAAARRMLEMTEDSVRLPSRLMGRLLGKGGQVAKAIVDKAKLHKLIVGEETGNGEDESGSTTSIRFLGMRDAVEDAKYMLDYQLEVAKQLDELQRQMQQLLGGAASAAHVKHDPTPKGEENHTEEYESPHESPYESSQLQRRQRQRPFQHFPRGGGGWKRGGRGYYGHGYNRNYGNGGYNPYYNNNNDNYSYNYDQCYHGNGYDGYAEGYRHRRNGGEMHPRGGYANGWHQPGYQNGGRGGRRNWDYGSGQY